MHSGRARTRYEYGRGFGQTVTDRYGKTFTEHGQDILVPSRTGLNAPVGGTVVFAGEKGQLGNHVIIQGDDGVFYWFAHLSQISVSAGQKITEGTSLGLSGGAENDPGRGNATGAHLWFATSKTRSLNTAFDPRGHVSSAMFGAEDQPLALMSVTPKTAESPDTPPALPANATGEQIDSYVRRYYPDLEPYFHQVPELRTILLRGITEGWIEDTRHLDSAIRSSQWWKTHNAGERANIFQTAADRAKAEKDIAFRLHESSQQFLVPVDDSMIGRFAKQINKGHTTEDDFLTYLRGQAAGLFPAFSLQIQQGVDPSTLLSPYRNMAAQELERNVDYRDPLMQQIGRVDPKTGTTMTLSDYRSYLRAQPEWNHTSGAKDMAYQTIAMLGQELGSVA